MNVRICVSLSITYNLSHLSFFFVAVRLILTIIVLSIAFRVCVVNNTNYCT